MKKKQTWKTHITQINLLSPIGPRDVRFGSAKRKKKEKNLSLWDVTVFFFLFCQLLRSWRDEKANLKVESSLV